MVYFRHALVDFGHVNIIQYCARPFLLLGGELCRRCGFGRVDFQDAHGNHCCHPDIWAHDEGLIERWNAVVAPDDVVYHLGDFALAPLPYVRDILSRLNGQKYLIMGNHDRHTNKAYREAGFFEVGRERSLSIGQTRLKLKHDPKRIDDDLWGYDFVLCGHVHGAWKERPVEASRFGEKKTVRVINVGVDVRGFRPVSLEELVATTGSCDRRSAAAVI